MKRTILAIAALTALTYPAQAIQRLSDNPPNIPVGTDSTAALLKMKKAGWIADAGRCLKAYPTVCEMNFVNRCGAVALATFHEQKLTAVKFSTFEDNPPGGMLPASRCPRPMDRD